MIRKQHTFLLFLILLLAHFSILGQTITIIDDFTDSNYTAAPKWFGDTGKFIINADKQLQLDDIAFNSPAHLAINSTIISNAQWEFWVKMDFAPSSSNYAKVYLSSNNQDLTKSLNGYFLKIGGVSGTADDISLYRQDGNSSSLLIDGIDGTVGLAPAKSKVKVTKDSAGEWELFIDTSAAGNTYVSQGKAIDLKHAESSYFGLLCHYTSTRSDKFYFDNFFLQGEAFKDTTRPQLQSITVLDSVSLKLGFNEAVEAVSAKNTNNYSLGSSLANPSFVDFIGNDSTQVELHFPKPFENGKSYFLKVENIKDRTGNILLKDSLKFLYFLPAHPKYREVVINEFYPDESASNGLPAAEFIEIFNSSNKIFDLKDWKISDAASSVSLPAAILRPGSYVIICSRSDSLQYAKHGKTIAISSLPSLNNNGDLIRLKSKSDKIIDELRYDKSWYGKSDKQNGGWTIEQINPFTLCSGKHNFIASTAPIGGTPGKINSQFNSTADSIPPKLLDAEVLSASEIILYFNEPIDSNSIADATYIFDTKATVDTALKTKDEASILLQLKSPLDSNKINQLTITNLLDCPGNSITKHNQIDLLVPVKVEFRDLVINEIFVNTKNSNGLPSAPFIEIYNASNKIFQLKDFTIGNGSSQESLNRQVLKSGEYLILCPLEHKASYSKYGITNALDNFPSFTQSGAEIFLSDHQGNLIDYVNYTDEWYKDEQKKKGGWTLEQINPYHQCSGPYNFAASVGKIGGSPGNINSTFSNQKDENPPQLLKALVYTPDSIQLIFDEGIDKASVDFDDFSFSKHSINIQSLSFSPFVYHTFFLKLNQAIDSGKVLQLKIENINDCHGNKIEHISQKIAAPEIASKGDLIINEILFNPHSGGNDFVEIYNRSDKIIDLRNWKIANGKNHIADDKQNISKQPTSFYPGEFMVITENEKKVLPFYPKARAERFLKIDKLPAYNNDQGEVFLYDEDNKLIDHIAYSEGMHFELLKEVKGVSLERINPNVGSDESDNFHSAAESENFATPGYQNSQYSLSTTFKGKVNISPETFSPNNDGYQDWLNINYQFPESGYVANISIYDKKGRLIRKLTNNELLGKKGSFKWDGLTEDRQKAAIGVYLIFFEAFNTKGEIEAFKKAAVLAN